jgi:glycosyltransferase involved in cell wall biosynthesis
MLTFAIVIPNLNQSHFLPTALESLRYQSVPFKLAIMDGGSTDNFRDVVNKYSDIITHLRSGPDNGQADAIKEGKNKVSGDIVAWLNADDYYFPEALDKVSKFFKNNPDIDVVYGDVVHVSPKGLFQTYFPAIQEFDDRDLTRTCFICQPACFVRRTAYNRVGGLDHTLHYTMDWDLWCRLSKSGARFSYLHDVLAAVRYYPGTKTLSSSWGRYMELFRIEKKYGHRVLPRSWLGSYLFDLSFKKKMTSAEKSAFAILKSLSRIKKKFIGLKKLDTKKIKTIYGFHPWESIVEGQAIIHMPWYENQKWDKLRLKVNPETDKYHVKINGQTCDEISFKNAYLYVKLPDLKNPHRRISIRCQENKRWRLLEFSCEMENDDI